MSSSAWGFLILVPALALHVLDAGMHSQILSAVASILAIPGLSLLFLGIYRTRAIGFPLAFMFFYTPHSTGTDRALAFDAQENSNTGCGLRCPKVRSSVVSRGNYSSYTQRCPAGRRCL